MPLSLAETERTQAAKGMGNMTEAEKQAPLVVYTIVKRERDGRNFWVRIGTAFRNRDGSLSALLDAVPTNGTLHIREQRPLPLEHEGHASPSQEVVPAE